MYGPRVEALPIDRVIVERVDSAPTGKEGCTHHLISGHLAQNAEHVQYQTVNDLRAALCMRAKVLGKAVIVRWKRTPYGKDIMRVEVER